MQEKINKVAVIALVLSCIGVAASNSLGAGVTFGVLAGLSSLLYDHSDDPVYTYKDEEGE